jgi:hypothetical protein
MADLRSIYPNGFNALDHQPLTADHTIYTASGARMTDTGVVDLDLTVAQLFDELGVPDVREGKDGKYYLLGQCSGTRKNENMGAMYLAVLDLDTGNVQETDIRAKLDGLVYAAHTTHSSRPNSLRWRVVLPLSRPATQAEHEATSDKLNSLFNADPSNRKPSQLWYFPSCPADQAANFQYFDTLATGELLHPVVPLTAAPVDYMPVNDSRFDIQAGAGPGERHDKLNAYVWKLLSELRPLAEIKDLLGLYNNTHCSPPHDKAELDRVYRDAVKDFKAKSPDAYKRAGPDPDAPVRSALDKLRNLSVTHRLAEMDANLKKDDWIFPRLVLSGQTTLFVAKYNGGKTLLTLRFLSDLVARGEVDPSKIFYINADDDYQGTAYKGAIAKRLGINMISPAESGMKPADVLQMMTEVAAQGDASGVVFIMDTLKKFADMMSKKSLADAFAMFRELNARNATVILLGHANKYDDKETGRMIHEGTGDVVNDSDCVYYMYNTEGSDGYRTVNFVREKSRGNSAKTLTYKFRQGEGVSYTEMMDSVELVDDESAKRLVGDRKKAELHEKYEAEIRFMRDVLSDGELNQSAIMDLRKNHAMHGEVTHAGLVKALKILNGDIWETRTDVKNNNAKLYSFKGTGAKRYQEGSRGE